MQLVGDDLFVTNPEILKRGIDEKVGNALLVKLNQIGTVTETLDAIEMARDAGYASDHLAPLGRDRRHDHRRSRRGTDAGQIKTGSASRTDRVAKYNQLLRIDPEDLIEEASRRDLPAIALVDRNGVYGAPRFYKAAREAGLKALVGAEIVLCLPLPAGEGRGEGRSRKGSRRKVASPADPPLSPLPRLTLLVENRTGYRNLCRLITAGALGKPKGETAVSLEDVAARADGLVCLTGGDEGPVARALASEGIDAARASLERLAAIFPGRLHVELQRHRRRGEEHRNQALVDLARRLRLPLTATNGVRYARAKDKELHDVLTAIRCHTPLDAAGGLLAGERERHLKGAREMAQLFPDRPEALESAFALSQRLDFTLADLGYRFPEFPLPPGETPASYLRRITWNGARTRFRPLTARAQAQIEKELAMIEKLDLPGYFLIVWDIVRFCREENILVQGRGSAANSAVCYALASRRSTR